MKLVDRHRPRPHIDMTPLIDCVFTMMIVIMMAATFQRVHFMQMNLPSASGTEESPLPDIVVSVDEAGHYFVDKQSIAPGELEALLRIQLAKSKRKVVTFQGDQKIAYQWFVHVLEASRAAGADHLDVVHMKGERR